MGWGRTAGTGPGRNSETNGDQHAGGGLLAIATDQSMYWVTDIPLSGASPLPQGISADRETSAGLGGGFVFDLGEVLFSQLRQVFRTVATAQFLQRATHAVQLAVYRLQVVKQLADGTGHRVGHVFADAVGIEADFLGHGFTFGFLLITDFRLDDDAPWNTNHGRPRRHGLGHHRIGADLGPGTHSERAKHLGARP